MGIIVFLLIAGWGVYQFFKFNTSSGVETTRAYVYLEALLNGETKEAAQGLASGDMMNLDTEVLRHILDEIRVVHGGRSLSMVAEAYRRGMTSRMSWWYQWSASQCDPSPSARMVYTIPLSMKERDEKQHKERMPEWVRSFTLQFVIKELEAAPSGPIPDAPLIPDDLLDLMEGTMPQHLQSSLPASLRLYMDYAYPEIRDYDTGLIPGDVKDYLTKAIRHVGQPGMVIETMQKLHVAASGSPMTDAELDELLTGMKQRQAEGVDVVQMMYGMGLLSITKEEFRARHGKSYDEFEADMAFGSNRVTD